jgi:hypothetical protein
VNNRILYSNNGTIEDFSVALSSYSQGSKTFTYVAGEDYLYIGSRLPFNHIYFKFSAPSSNSVSMNVEYYDGNAWVSAVEVIDETSGFTQSGFVQFTPDRQTGWQQRSTNYGGETVEGLESVNIYDLYWTRMSFSGNLTAATITWVGNLFSNDSDLGTEYPDLVRPNTLTSFKAGKTNWEEQHVRAAQILVDDLVNKGIVCGAGQILDWREFTNASIHKVAEIAFNAFGDDYVDNTIAARKEYNERLSKRFYRVDKNNNAVEERVEMHRPVGYFTR